MLVAVLCGLLGMAIAAAQGQRVSTVAALTARTGAPLVIGHRGAPGYRPEHTLASYAHAIDLGVDFIEPDLVSTKDGVLIARHENEISGTTDVAQKFPDRKVTKTIDGRTIEGYFTEDFTLAEIKTLRAKERLPFRNQGWNGYYEIPTFEEVIGLAKRRSREAKRTIGIYPETKHPSYFRFIGLALEPPLVKALTVHGYVDASAPVFIQSFEVQNLKDLRKLTQVRLVQLMGGEQERPYDFIAAGNRRTYDDLMKPEGLAEIAAYANGIGPFKRSIVPQGPDRKLRRPTSLVTDAHRAGLVVHPYTFRDEPEFLAPDYRLDPIKEYLQFYELGVDGVFSDFGDTAVRARLLLPRSERFIHID
ncbi:MAG: glpQ [Nitrobacter vulgaris]|jgi:glycerophosphoryl diester phosphodiesterase|nr:glpQ [Nitrobacter vulgaris]